jgi:hypothetical protein
MNKLLNGDFLNSTDNWENGPSDYPFIWDPTYKWIRGDSPSGPDYKVFTIQQPFNVSDMVILAKLTAWRRYESVAGNFVDGAVKARVKLQKPDSSWVTLADETKTAQTGSGNILDQYDVLSHFSAQGNYKLMLQTESRAACDRTNHTEKIEEPYGPWTNTGFTIEDPNCYVKGYVASPIEKYAKIEKSIEILDGAHTATLTLDAKGLVNLYCSYPGYAHFKVTLSKTGGGTWVLYDAYLSDGNWTTILNALDLTSYMTSAGTYTLKLEAWVASGWDGDVTYYQSEAWFGNCELTAQWYSYTYTVSRGFWDDINLDICRKVFKTVVESIGCSESQTKKISIGAKEDLFLSESYQALRLNVKKTVSEEIYMAESFFKKIYKIVKEEIGLKELSYSGIRVGLNKAVTEDLFLDESFSWRKLIRREAMESISLSEKLTAKRTAGNIVTYFDITDLTEWQDRTPVVTAWIKEKTVMNN